jgi:hypothetical protein
MDQLRVPLRRKIVPWLMDGMAVPRGQEFRGASEREFYPTPNSTSRS